MKFQKITLRKALLDALDYDDASEAIDPDEVVTYLSGGLEVFLDWLRTDDEDLKDYWALYMPYGTAYDEFARLYFYRSGNKYLSRQVFDYMQDDTIIEGITKASENAYLKYRYKWVSLANALFTEYDPLKNYDLTETITHGHTITDSPRAIRETTTATETDTSSVVSGDVERKVSAFDSSEYQNSEKNVNNDVTTRVTGDADKNIVTSTSKGLSGEDTLTHGGIDTNVKYGRINFDPSKAVMNEVMLRNAHQFLEIILQDLDSVLFLGVY